MADFIQAHEFTAKWEGGITDHPADRGGYTAYGVSTEFFRELLGRQAGYAFLKGLGFSRPFQAAQMRKITRKLAAEIFRFEFWDGQELGDWPSQALATVYYDMSVNHGKGGACRMLQQTLNAVEGAGLKVDGQLGPLSKAAAKNARGLICALWLLDRREAYFNSIVASRPSQKVFLKGWLNRTNDLRKLVRKLDN